jgi:ubiquinone/menaquinone biosynthesis C-methylase UbiE
MRMAPPGFEVRILTQPGEESSESLRPTARERANPLPARGLLEEMPVEDGWADVVITNGVINLCADKKRVFFEVWRVLRPGGRLQFGDIANGKPVPESAIRNIDLWTA